MTMEEELEDVDIEELECRLYSQVFHSSSKDSECKICIAADKGIGNRNECDQISDNNVANSSEAHQLVDARPSPHFTQKHTIQNQVSTRIENRVPDVIQNPVSNMIQNRVSDVIQHQVPYMIQNQVSQNVLAKVNEVAYREQNNQRKNYRKPRKRNRFRKNFTEEKFIERNRRSFERLNQKTRKIDELISIVRHRRHENTQGKFVKTSEVITLSDSDGESCVEIPQPRPLVSLLESEDETDPKQNEVNIIKQEIHELEGKSQEDSDDDDVIIIENPKPEIICIDDDPADAGKLPENEVDLTEKPACQTDIDLCTSSEQQNEATSEVTNTSEANASDDFLETAISSEMQNNFNFSLHGTDFEDPGEFLRPHNPCEVYETGSSCSTSDFNPPLKEAVFNEVEFPGDDLFSGSNMEQFSALITTKRVKAAKNKTQTSQIACIGQSTRKSVAVDSSSGSSSESDYEEVTSSSRKGRKKLPNLSHMVISDVEQGSEIDMSFENVSDGHMSKKQKKVKRKLDTNDTSKKTPEPKKRRKSLLSTETQPVIPNVEKCPKSNNEEMTSEHKQKRKNPSTTENQPPIPETENNNEEISLEHKRKTLLRTENQCVIPEGLENSSEEISSEFKKKKKSLSHTENQSVIPESLENRNEEISSEPKKRKKTLFHTEIQPERLENSNEESKKKKRILSHTENQSVIPESLENPNEEISSEHKKKKKTLLHTEKQFVIHESLENSNEESRKKKKNLSHIENQSVIPENFENSNDYILSEPKKKLKNFLHTENQPVIPNIEDIPNDNEETSVEPKKKRRNLLNTENQPVILNVQENLENTNKETSSSKRIRSPSNTESQSEISSVQEDTEINSQAIQNKSKEPCNELKDKHKEIPVVEDSYDDVICDLSGFEVIDELNATFDTTEIIDLTENDKNDDVQLTADLRIVNCTPLRKTITNKTHTSTPKDFTRKSFSEMWNPNKTEYYSKCVDTSQWEVENFQSTMSDDPKLWQILPSDRNPRLSGGHAGPRCLKCRHFGHVAQNCPTGSIVCSTCAGVGHFHDFCTQNICRKCGRRIAPRNKWCHKCLQQRHRVCNLCRVRGHGKESCPDLWRRYYLTTKPGPLKKPEGKPLKPASELWCSSCAKSGHLESSCYKNEYPQPMTIKSYEEVHPCKNPDEKQESKSKERAGSSASSNNAHFQRNNMKTNIPLSPLPQQTHQELPSQRKTYQEIPPIMKTHQEIPQLMNIRQEIPPLMKSHQEIPPLMKTRQETSPLIKTRQQMQHNVQSLATALYNLANYPVTDPGNIQHMQNPYNSIQTASNVVSNLASSHLTNYQDHQPTRERNQPKDVVPSLLLDDQNLTDYQERQPIRERNELASLLADQSTNISDERAYHLIKSKPTHVIQGFLKIELTKLSNLRINPFILRKRLFDLENLGDIRTQNPVALKECYRELNMLIFGVYGYKNGYKCVKLLRQFQRTPPTIKFGPSDRKSVWKSYNYIFGKIKHDPDCYKYLNSIINKEGQRRS